MEERSPHTGGKGLSEEGSKASATEKRHYLEYVKVIVATLLVALFLKTFVVEAYRIPSSSMENTLMVGDFLIVNKLAYRFRTPTQLPFTNVAMPSLSVPLLSHVHRGDVVVFEYPGSYNEIKPPRSVNYVKRCVGLPGDTVRIVHGTVIVNGMAVDLPRSAKPLDDNEFFSGWRRMTSFPPGSSFTLFDYGPLVVPKKGDTVWLNSSSLSRWRILIEREGHTIFADESGTIILDGIATDHYIINRNYYFMLGDNRDNSLDSRFWGFVTDKNIVGEALLVYWSWDSDSSARTLLAKPSNVRWNRIGTIIR